MEPKLFGVALAGIVAGLGISRLLPHAASPETAAGPAVTAAPAPTPFACVRAAESVEAERAKHAGRVTVFLSWHPNHGTPWLPTYERIRASYASRGVDFVGVTSEIGRIEKICAEHRLRWPQIVPATWDGWQAFFENQGVVVVDRSGEVRFRGWNDPTLLSAIEDALAAEKRDVLGRVLHRGRPIAGLSASEPKIEIRNAFGYHPAAETLEYFKATGSFVARLSPGTYSASVVVGDEYIGNTTFGVPDYPSNAPIDVEIGKRIRLTSPIDSRIPQPKWDDPSPFHPSPVRIAWDPVPGADRYHVSIWSNTAEAKGASATTRETRAVFDLPPAEFYVQVGAVAADGSTIGQSRIQYDGLPNQSYYRFRVPPK